MIRVVTVKFVGISKSLCFQKRTGVSIFIRFSCQVDRDTKFVTDTMKATGHWIVDFLRCQLINVEHSMKMLDKINIILFIRSVILLTDSIGKCGRNFEELEQNEKLWHFGLLFDPSRIELVNAKTGPPLKQQNLVYKLLIV